MKSFFSGLNLLTETLSYLHDERKKKKRERVLTKCLARMSLLTYKNPLEHQGRTAIHILLYKRAMNELSAFDDVKLRIHHV
jgi:hypothetical protein